MFLNAREVPVFRDKVELLFDLLNDILLELLQLSPVLLDCFDESEHFVSWRKLVHHALLQLTAFAKLTRVLPDHTVDEAYNIKLSIRTP